MSREQLYASFLLDRDAGTEIALLADCVTEATGIQGSIRKLPTTIDFLEGVMHLRDKAIPVINLKKRMGLSETSYDSNAKVAVVSGFEQQYGLLFDDIQEVFKADDSHVFPISKAFQTEDKIITSLIHLDAGKRTIELLDLNEVFQTEEHELTRIAPVAKDDPMVTYSRNVIFQCGEQLYGIPVSLAQEITFLSDVDSIFQSGYIDGALKLRGSTIPVVNSKYLLAGIKEELAGADEHYRVLVLDLGDCAFGMIVQEITEIINIPEHEILTLPMDESNIKGVYEAVPGRNIMLLDIEEVVSQQIERIRSMSRLKNHNKEEDGTDVNSKGTHHLITENGYLVFSIGKNFGLEIKDVQEIIEHHDVLYMPGTVGAQTGIINLRGQVVPVVNLRNFLDYDDKPEGSGHSRLIICKSNGYVVAFEVDSIVTIYKQEQFHMTPSLNPRLAVKKDTLDRLIEFLGDDNIREHVLILNVSNLVKNHLGLSEKNIVDDEPNSISAK